MQELFDLFSKDESSPAVDTPSYLGSEYPGQLFLALSQDALVGTEGPRTMKLKGSIQDHHLTILVDSGSSHTFLSQALAFQLNGLTQLPGPIRVQVANGAILQCSSHIPAGIWSVQEFSFTSDLKIIPLDHYDLILGMDWLEQFSPMKVH